MAALEGSVIGVYMNLQEVTALWQFGVCYDDNLDVALHRCQSEGDVNGFTMQVISVIKGRVAEEYKVLLERPLREGIKI
jgi:hypothetical protein